MAKKWIAKAIKSPGALHRQLGVPAGEKIPAGKMAAARAGKHGPLAEKRAHLAKTLGSFEQGGLVPATGPYRLHRGEEVIPAPRRMTPAVGVTPAGMLPGRPRPVTPILPQTFSPEAGTRQPKGKTSNPDSAITDAKKYTSEPVREAKADEGAACKAIRAQVGSNIRQADEDSD